MKYVFVSPWWRLECENPLDLIAELSTLGYQVTGLHSSAVTHPELQGCPVFDFLVGPMLDGQTIRYEKPP